MKLNFSGDFDDPYIKRKVCTKTGRTKDYYQKTKQKYQKNKLQNYKISAGADQERAVVGRWGAEGGSHHHPHQQRQQQQRKVICLLWGELLFLLLL